MVDFDDLKSKAEALIGEHSEQVEDGIEKVADLAGKKFGHAGQIDQAADKLKEFVAEQADPPHAKQGPGPGPKRAQPRPEQGRQRPRPKQRPHPRPS